MRIIVTGGSGFIGSALVRRLVNEGHEVRNLDLLTYAADSRALSSVERSPLYTLVRGDIGDSKKVNELISRFAPEQIFHLAAESHVDRSIMNADAFVQTNIVGTYVLLKESLEALRAGILSENFRFIHVSTDEVYGSLNENEESFTEKTAYRPNSPYSASKASSDLIARSFYQTYGLPLLTTHCSNNYGPFQHTEKLIPTILTSCIKENLLPVYGQGKNVREWLHVDDHVDALVRVGNRGKLGETYNIGSGEEVPNLLLVQTLCSIMDQLKPRAGGKPYAELIKFVEDRPGHDFRYSISCEKIRHELGWSAKWDLSRGLRSTAEWYLEQLK